MSETESHRSTAGQTASSQPVAEQLKREAVELRHHGRPQPPMEYSPFQKLLATAALVALIGGSLFLALASQPRQYLLTRLGDEWARLYQTDEQRGFHRLPAPPPKRVEPRQVLISPTIISSDGGGPYLVDEPQDAIREPGPRAHTPPPKNNQSASAFSILQARSAAAARLATGKVPGITFKEWQPVSAQHPIYYIDLIGVRESDAREQHYIWSINIVEPAVKAESQAARDLEASG